MGRHKIEIGRWASDKIRLDIIRELKMEAARLDVELYDAVNRALWIGLQDIRRTRSAEMEPKSEPPPAPMETLRGAAPDLENPDEDRTN